MKQSVYSTAFITASFCIFSCTLLNARTIELKNNSPSQVTIKLFFKAGRGEDQRTIDPFSTAKIDVGAPLFGKLVRRVDVLEPFGGKLLRDGKDAPGGANMGLSAIEYDGKTNDIIFIT